MVYKNTFRIILSVLTIITVYQVSLAANLKEQQLKYPRVRNAIKEKESVVKETFIEKGIAYPPKEIFIRAFKKEEILELWARVNTDSPFVLIKTYDICMSSGILGPKRKEGDRQVPEGFYYVDRFNPTSKFHLSLGINYPNNSDRILGYKKSLGGDIFIHGNCVTIGCIPIRDKYIKELYIIAVEAKSNGQNRIPVHIYPAKLTSEGLENIKKIIFDKGTHKLWDDLKKAYDYFEKNKRIPKFNVDNNGKYIIEP